MKLKKKFLVAGLSALLIFGVIAAANAMTNETGGQRGPGFFRSFGMGDFGMEGFGMKHARMDDSSSLGDLGLPEDATSEEISDALWEKRLSNLGLTEDSTIRELRAALEAENAEKMQEMEAQMQERHQQMLEELGLSGDATQEEIMAAMKQNREENPADCPGKMGGDFGRRRPMTAETEE